MPVLIMLHGLGSNGSYVVEAYRGLADKYKFIIIAPDSHSPLDWYIPDTAQKPFTEDWYHIIACYQYVRGRPRVRFDYNHISLGGNSRGGYGAVALATRTTFATHSMCTHSRFIANQLGTHMLPVWVSTGQSDPLFSPAVMQQDLAVIKRAWPHLLVTFRVFPGEHSIGTPAELLASIKWWYATKGAKSTRI